MTAGKEMISITLNGEQREAQAGWTLLDLLASLDRDPRTVAIEHQAKIVPRDRFGEVELAAGDQVEIVHFVQGG